MISYDPSEKIKEIQQLLVSDKKKIGFLFGAGTSLAKKSEKSPYIPAVNQMTKIIVEDLSSKSEKYRGTIQSIKTDILDNKEVFTVETLLTNIENKISIIGKGTLNGMNKDELSILSNDIRNSIREIVSVHKSINKDAYKEMAQYDFGAWIKSAFRKSAVEIFTTNYDYLLEIGLEQNDVPYYDGFTGSYKPFFNAHSVEDIYYLPQQTKMWKIHGSLGLHQDGQKIIRSTSNNEDLLIYPSVLKYSNSKKQPYAAFMDRLNCFLKQNDAVLFVCGYSFGDEHINERIMSALQTDTTAHVYVFNYDIMSDEKGNRFNSFSEESDLAQLAKSCRKLSVLSTRKAIFGTQMGIWKLKREPDNTDTLNINWYFDEDAPYSDVEISKERKGDEQWNGEGELSIVNFSNFSKFLLNMIPKDNMDVINND